MGLQSNEEAAVATAKADLKAAAKDLDDARKELARTPRASNLQATRAVQACERSHNDAKSRLKTAEAKLAQANR